MSGGHYDYDQYKILNIKESIESAILHDNEETAEYKYNFSEKTLEEFKTAIKILDKAFIYAQRIDWLLSGDDGENTFHERLKEELARMEKHYVV